jgi:hypothetical protein
MLLISTHSIIHRLHDSPRHPFPPSLELDLFTNRYLAGIIIFGGGPVVILLLREYVVEPGWVVSQLPPRTAII